MGILQLQMLQHKQCTQFQCFALVLYYSICLKEIHIDSCSISIIPDVIICAIQCMIQNKGIVFRHNSKQFRNFPIMHKKEIIHICSVYIILRWNEYPVLQNRELSHKNSKNNLRQHSDSIGMSIPVNRKIQVLRMNPVRQAA